MITIAIESPYAGDVARNLAYLDRCIRDALVRGETPYASHQMLPRALDDDDPVQRSLGIKAGLAMSERLDERAFYVDLGWSRGMLLAESHYEANGLSYVVRQIGILDIAAGL